ncbi:MAG: hypothetical protein RJA07_185 [Bacteroidota bacterium]|jgi:hypothetical protein
MIFFVEPKMKFLKTQLPLFILIVAGIILLKSCRKKCPDNLIYFPDNNCIQLYYFDSSNAHKIYSPTITEVESNQQLRPSKTGSMISPSANFIGDYLPFDFNHTTNTFIFSDTSKADTIIISGLNVQAIYTQGDCGFQMKVNQPTIEKNTFANHCKCVWGNWNSATQTITLKITF